MEGVKIMGKTSNAVKQRWNAEHYAQVKVHVKPETAAAFKAACAASGYSMASEISAFMEEFSRPLQGGTPYIKVKTLGDRRKTMHTVINLLSEMRDAEDAYMDNMPDNLKNSAQYEMAEERIDRLTEAIETAEDIYG